MKINEITQPYKITQINPTMGAEISAPDGTKINLPPEKMAALLPDPHNPNGAKLNLATPAQQPQAPKPATQTQSDNSSDGQIAPPMPQSGQSSPEPAQAPAQPAQAQQPAGQQAQPQQQQLPKVGTEVELDDNIGSTMQSETFDDVDDDDLLSSGENKDIGGDPTDDFINDVVDKDFEKNAGRSKRNIVKPDPIKESEELLAMLTIAGLR